MEQRFSDKIALVTGGSHGMGSVIAQKLAEYGADIVIVDLKIDENSDLFQNIRNMGRNVLGICLDISDVEAVRKTVKMILKKLGKIDILINNAGIYPPCPILEEEEDHFDKVIGVNLKGLFFMTQAVIKESMLPNQYGRIVNITSIDGKNPPKGQVVYSATKAGVISVTQSVALEMAGTNINCNAVAPGWIETEELLTTDRWKEYLPMIPARRLGKMSEIAEAVCFLCDDKVSYINGEILDVNGGMLMD